jgi:acetyltransferase-like isoleucine patch superfamily enzyme
MQLLKTVINMIRTFYYQTRYWAKEKIMPYYLALRFPSCRFGDGVLIDKNSELGQGVCIEPRTELRKVIVGRYTCIGPDSRYTNCQIGAFCSLGPQIMVGLGSHPTQFVSTYPGFYSSHHSTALIRFTKEQLLNEHLDVKIGSDVWIGARVIILGGIKIGDGAILAAGSVVTQDVPPYAIVGGVPAKIIRMRFEGDVISKLQATKWWEKQLNG